MWSAPYPTVLGTYAPLITPSLTRAHLRGLAETDVDHGFPKIVTTVLLRHVQDALKMRAQRPLARSLRASRKARRTHHHEDLVLRRSACTSHSAVRRVHILAAPHLLTIRIRR